ncbi:hypothetical protein [Saccharothrix algeriensis]|uniref:Uncharacterized protein n=1 Tax=Saccharothrix algeriensis TaxID=173560 RepID=A0ABS2S7W3_9PSEU|nr:hypothetical protein [Saccharothrix algeriensis]MBM7811930.1 hypothetical protein [Saccharothrix algeriensis]
MDLPDEGDLPPGGQRDLTVAIHVLYANAGMPGTRTISNAIRARDDLPDTVSHEAVRGILVGKKARWSKVASVALQLLHWSAIQVDPDGSFAGIHRLWIAANGRTVSGSPHVVVPHVEQFTSRRNGSSVEIAAFSDNSSQASSGSFDMQSDSSESKLFIRWQSKVGFIDVYDREIAKRIVKGGGSDE